jgi:hypothetical protein
MRLSPADINTEHDGVNLVEETVPVQLCSPGCSRASPWGIRHDARLHAATSELRKDARRFEVRLCVVEDRPQKRPAGVGKRVIVEFDVVLEQCTDTATQRPHRMILAFPVELQCVLKHWLFVDLGKGKSDSRNHTAKAPPQNRWELISAVVPDQSITKVKKHSTNCHDIGTS